ncbi:MAG: hypothetical protein MI757_08625 [Pirellulales bacterium]|nr:hypothetical protein [Pirellulales bacterium]
MKTADVQSSAARLKEGFEMLNIRWELTKDAWQDKARQNFEEHHLRPLDGPVAISLESIRRLGNVLARAQQECS